MYQYLTAKYITNLISGFGVLLALLGGKQTFYDVATNIIFLGEVEQLADLGGTLGSKTTGDIAVSKSGNFLKKLKLARLLKGSTKLLI